MRKIPFLDLKKINEPYFEKINEISKNVVESGWYILGKEVKGFEENFAKYCCAKQCVGVANGLDALILILKANNFPRNSEIIVPSNTYIATILAITLAGYQPVLVEPDPKTYLIDISKIEKKINKKTKAILLVNLYGRICDIEPAKDLAKKYSLKLFEDSAQSHGAFYKNSVCGSLTDASGFSFYPTKNLGALGDGGAVTTNDDELANKIRILRNYGSEKKYAFDYQGFNSRLDEIQAAILNLKLTNLDSENLIRRKLANRYLSEIHNQKISLPTSANVFEDAWHLFVVRTNERNKFQNYLSENGIGTEIHYPIPPHKQLAYKSWNKLNYPISEKIHNEVLSLPLNPTLSEDDTSYIIEKINLY